MLKNIIYHELKNILFSPKFTATFIITTLLLIMSVLLGIKHYNNNVKQYETVQRLVDQEMREQSNWMSLSSKVHRVPDPMQVFVSGVNDDIGRYSGINSFKGIKLTHSVYSDEPYYAVFKFIDFTFIVTIVLSLFIILFTYDAINGEAEKGTLQLIFSNSLSRKTYIAGKFIGVWLGLIIPLLIPLLLSVLLILVFNVPFTGEHWIKIFSLFGLTLLYFTFFVGWGIFCSTLTKRTSVSFLIALVSWICFVFIIPRAGVIIAGQIIQVPGAAEIQGQQESYTKERWQKFMDDSQERWKKRNESMGNLSEEDRESARDENMWGWMEEEDKERKKVEKDIDDNQKLLTENLRNKKTEHEKLAFTLSRISPVSSFNLAAMNIAGTDIYIKDRYEDAMNSYREAFNTFKDKKQKESGGHGGIRVMIDSEAGFKIDTGREKGAIDLSELPRFSAPQKTNSEIAQAALIDSSVISLFTILIFAAGFFSFLRFDVR